MENDIEHIWKGKIEFIIVPYTKDKKRWLVVVSRQDKPNEPPKFPFYSKEEAKNWVENFE